MMVYETLLRRRQTQIKMRGMIKMKWLVIGPQTRTARAQELLGRAGISSQRKKLTETAEGCVYALGVSDAAAARAVVVLEGAGIRSRIKNNAPN